MADGSSTGGTGRGVAIGFGLAVLLVALSAGAWLLVRQGGAPEPAAPEAAATAEAPAAKAAATTTKSASSTATPAPAAGSAGGTHQDASATPAPSQPTAQDVERCNYYAAQIAQGRDVGELARDAIVGGALGAGVGAAAGAIAKGGKGAGKGAGVGAVVGVTAGTLYGLNEQNKRSDAAKRAYGECMAARGY